MAASAYPRLRGQGTEATFSSNVKVVNTLFTVQNRSGELIKDLKQDDFNLLEDGRPQTIRYFSQQSDLPLTLGLMVDTSMSQQKVMDAERGASMRFLDQMFRENKDHVFLMQFDMSVQLRQGVTTSLKPLYDVLAFVDTPTRRELMVGSERRHVALRRHHQGVERSHEAAAGTQSADRLSDGVDVGSEAPLADAIEAAQRADTLIYSIEFSDATFYGGFGGGERAQRADQTSVRNRRRIFLREQEAGHRSRFSA